MVQELKHIICDKFQIIVGVSPYKLSCLPFLPHKLFSCPAKTVKFPTQLQRIYLYFSKLLISLGFFEDGRQISFLGTAVNVKYQALGTDYL